NSLTTYSAQLARTTRNAYDSYENVCYSLAYGTPVQNYLQNDTPEEDYTLYTTLFKQFSDSAQLSSSIADIAVYGENGSFVSLNGARANYEPYTTSVTPSRFPYHALGTATVNSHYCHILAMPIYSLNSAEDRYLGILFLAIDLEDLLGNSMEGAEVFSPIILLTDASQNIVYGDTIYAPILPSTYSENQITRKFLPATNASYSVNGHNISSISYHLYVLVEQKKITGQLIALSRGVLIELVIMSLLILLFIFFLYKPFISSLNQMRNFMQQVSSGNRNVTKTGLTVDQGVIGLQEIEDITNSFNEMLTETDRLNHTIFETYTRMYEMEANNRKTEIAYLRSQINPHFLYNTLTLICGLASASMDEEIISVTNALSQIFRYSIKGKDIVTLAEELEIVKSYLMIQKERFGDRFEVSYAVDEECLSCKIPRMVLQPLVENAIVHGLEPSETPGKLLIGAGPNPSNSYYAVWVYDTGVGMSAEKRDKLRAALKNGDVPKNPDEHTSIGLLNVNSRMILYYGPEYTLILDSDEGVGTNVQFRIPYVNAYEEGE
nr:sensor histidine kinase [Lachnospiraceae bacterium]